MKGVNLTEQQRQKIVALYESEVSVADLAARFNISSDTPSKLAKRAKKQAEKPAQQ